jgi:dTDP-4-amino-4,6-dideoxygalactose transaminase
MIGHKVLVDVSVFNDVLQKNDDWQECLAVLELARKGQIKGWISSLTKALLYLHHVKTIEDQTVRKLIHELTNAFSEIPLRRIVNEQAMKDAASDFLCSIQLESAKQFHLDAIITSDKKGFPQNDLSVYTPEEFLNCFYDPVRDPGSVTFLDLKAQHHEVYNEIDDRMTDIMTNTGFILGPHVQEFEERFAEFHGAQYCVGVSSGTDALHVALLALGIGPGDRVVVPVNTFMATPEAVSLTGALPVFVDMEPRTYNLDCKKLKALLQNQEKDMGQGSGNIKAIIPVHLYGQPANMKDIMAIAKTYHLKVIEDCCQAHLAGYDNRLVGNFGDFGAFSFYPGKNLGAYGEAGALITHDEGLYQRAKLFRQHGETERYHHQVIGHNFRMSAFQGAVLNAKLGYLRGWTEKRRANARLYNELLKDMTDIRIPEELDKTYCVYHLYVIRHDDRDGLQTYLREKGIATGLHYPIPLHMQVAYRFIGHSEGDFPVAEKAARRILSLPMYPELKERQIRYVAEMIKSYIRSLCPAA